MHFRLGLDVRHEVAIMRNKVAIIRFFRQEQCHDVHRWSTSMIFLVKLVNQGCLAGLTS